MAVWIYASLVGMQHSTKVSRALQTDAAFRLLSGGHAMSSATLRRFRQRHGAFFAQTIEWTILEAAERGMIDIEALAIDSV
ncbi:MAG: IS5/IS1182 family transposase, partial [Deltaproteobacteria bacterium]|nr:IS5/IS1182 family transposase [Deltaproteobacteria bacterium]